MQKSKIDRILEGMETLIAEKKNEAGGNDSNIDLPPQKDDSMPSGLTSDNGIDQQVANVVENVQQDVEQQIVISQSDESTVQQDTSVDEDDFEKIYNELMNSFQPSQVTDVTQISDATQTTEAVQEKLDQNNNSNYKELYEQERQKNYLLEGEKNDLSGQATYYKKSLDKEGEKQRELMDKIKDLEAQLRTVSAKSIPDNFVPLTQTYSLWQETKIPAHKWRAVKEALTIVEGLTGVPAAEYYNKIIKNEAPDIPEVKDNSSTTSKVQQNNQFTNGFIML